MSYNPGTISTYCYLVVYAWDSKQYELAWDILEDLMDYKKPIVAQPESGRGMKHKDRPWRYDP